jgi:enoyl-CoA hydratase
VHAVADIGYHVDAHVAVIELTAPARRNALTLSSAAELVRAVDEADADPDVGAIVVHGGAHFCAGADLGTLGDVRADPAGAANYRAIGAIYDAFLRLGSAAVPTIAAVRGAAVGAGLNLALAADLRIVARDARLISGFGRIGLHPGGGHFALLARAGGREAAAAMGLCGDGVSGARAAEIGMAWQAVDDSDTMPVALGLARQPAADPELSRAMVASLRLQSEQPGLSWAAAVQLERAPQMWSFRRAANASSGRGHEPA